MSPPIVQLQFEYATLSTVVGVVGGIVPFAVEFEGGIGDRGVTAVLEMQSARQVLVYLANEYDLAYDVSKKGHLVVRERRRGSTRGRFLDLPEVQ